MLCLNTGIYEMIIYIYIYILYVTLIAIITFVKVASGRIIVENVKMLSVLVRGTTHLSVGVTVKHTATGVKQTVRKYGT